MNVHPWVLEYLGLAMMGTAVFLGGWSIAAHRQSLPYRYWALYVGHLEKRLRDLFLLKVSGAAIARGQSAALVLVLATALYVGRPEIYAGLPIVALAPILDLERRRV